MMAERDIARHLGVSPSVVTRIAALALPFWRSEHKWRNRGRAFLLLVLTLCQVWLQLALNAWAARLFNAIELRSFDLFLAQLGGFAMLLAGSMAVFTLHLRARRRLQFSWRVWLSKQIIGAWLERGRHHQLGLIANGHDNADGRIAEDIRIVTESAIDLALSLLYCVLLLIGFVQVLWRLSGVVHVTLFGKDLAISGHLVALALVYASIVTLLANWVGRPLVDASNLRQNYEADFRFGLSRTREHAESIALLQGEPDERMRLLDFLRAVRRGWQRQTAGLTRIVLFSSAYNVLSTPFPVLIAAPRYILGQITLGTLMQTAQAFQQVASALSWPVDNLANIALWRASSERVLALQESLAALDAMLAHARPGLITVQGDGGHLRLENLAIADPGGAALMAPLTADIGPGEHVLLEGPADLGHKLMLAIAGVWRWGEGEIGLPNANRMFFLTATPFLPPGKLASTLCYPMASSLCEPQVMRDALVQAGLEILVPRLLEEEDWQRLLSPQQRQRLNIARLLVHRPEWIFVADATNALDRDSQREIADLLRTACGNAGVLALNTDCMRDGYFTRVLSIKDAHVI
jgi:putative ATP-binding cassette transporter